MSAREVNLLARLPNSRRNVTARAAARTPELILRAREYGQLYFDGPREYGYGGYRYDGRWIPVAEDLIRHFGVRRGDRVLDIGCAKGFLVKDLLHVCPGVEAFGLDISEYALMHCEPDTVGRLHLGNAVKLPFPDDSFRAAISINTIHNLERAEAVEAVREIERVAPGRGFIQVDSYRTAKERGLFLEWVLTARFHDYPDGWVKLFSEAGYTGWYYWTIITE